MDHIRSSPRVVPPRTGIDLSLTPAQFAELVSAKLDEVRAGIAEWALPVLVSGILGEL